MATIGPAVDGGPWNVAHDDVEADGIFGKLSFRGWGPTCDGVKNTRPRGETHGGLLQGSDSSHGVWAPNAPGLSKGSDHR